MSEARTSDLVVLLVITSLAVCGCCAKTAPSTVAECRSSDVLDGLSWKVDLAKDLAEQGCELNPSFPGKILCRHPELDVECKLP